MNLEDSKTPRDPNRHSYLYKTAAFCLFVIHGADMNYCLTVADVHNIASLTASDSPHTMSADGKILTPNSNTHLANCDGADPE